MATMSTRGTIRDLAAAAKEDLRNALANGTPLRPVYLLRRDGGTDKYTIDRATGRVTVVRLPGSVTLGMVVDQSDMPCLVSH